MKTHLILNIFFSRRIYGKSDKIYGGVNYQLKKVNLKRIRDIEITDGTKEHAIPKLLDAEDAKRLKLEKVL